MVSLHHIPITASDFDHVSHGLGSENGGYETDVIPGRLLLGVFLPSDLESHWIR